tara:strand:- start:633 stop:1070 length:438 start_codon:yes stop_codon:yes gene_type:complete
MEKTKFKKLVWMHIYLIIFYIVIIVFSEIIPFLTDYSQIEEQLYTGVLGFLTVSASLALFIIFFIILITGWALLLKFHRNGRFFYTVAVLSNILLSPLLGDEIVYGLFYPIEWMVIALEGLILYLIHFTPLRDEFGIEEPKISEV